ncbi:restriction endonuclease subunit S [Acidovorax sp. IB03]|uniref:restriction endonuclease subunit S n=1 Tax=Acidovorax sp. IB03 TaxID=2779366 RepID=UPI0018E81D88|nr:restriction endonuclease subunit S [Acidovorax sp. IB03]MBJ2162437.1 restriction endonuclease subunit S [Acidovorax sp. IB03]
MSEIPDTWLNTNLKTVANLVTGNTPSTKSPEYYGGSVPFVKPGDLDSADPITVTEQQLTELGAQQSRLVRAGSTLVSCIGNLGKVGFAGVPLATNQQINSAEFHREIVDDRYGYYLCKTLKSWMERESSATTIAILNKGKFGEAPFPLAPLPEQKRIANKLDTVLTRVDAVNTRLARVAPLLKRFRQSVLAAATSGRLTEDWRLDRRLPAPKAHELGTIIRVSSGQGLTAKQMVSSGGIPVFGGNGITGYHDQANTVEPTLLIGRVGYYCGSVHLTPPIAWVTDNALIVRHDPKIVQKNYLFFALQAIDLRQNDSSTAQPVISGQKIYGLLVVLPHFDEQTEIVRRVETLFAFADRLEARLAQAQTAATRLTPALLAKAFRGELVPQDPNDEPAAELLRRLQAERATAPKASAGRGRKAVVQS